MAEIGLIIDGKFRILGLLKRGGMSRVYLAEDLRLKKKWVVKEVLKYANGKENALSVHSAMREANIIKSLDHPAIVRIVDITQDEQALYIVEDYITGITLREIADSHAIIREEQLFSWAEQICEILIYLHGRNPPVIYRDIKPDNLILTESGHLKLIDFGIARLYKPGKEHDTVYLGTEKFAAPEQYEEYGAQTDWRTDIFGFGKTMEYMAGNEEERSAAFRKIIRKCTEPDPDERYADAFELLRDLRRGKTRGRRFIRAGGMFRGKEKARAGDMIRGGEMIRGRRTVKNGKWFRIGIISAAGIFLLTAVFLAFGKQDKQDVLKNEIMNMISSMKEDGVFHISEEEELLDLVQRQLTVLMNRPWFEEMAYEIGRLYFDFYSYGSNGEAGINGQDSRISMGEAGINGQDFRISTGEAGIISSVPWFSFAEDYDSTARIYATIGRFTEKRHQLLLNPDSPGEYLACFDQLCLLADLLDESDYPEMLTLSAYKQTLDFLQTSASGLQRDQVTQNDLADLYDEISRRVISMRTVSEQAGKLKNQIIENLQAVQESIGQAYESVNEQEGG